MNFSSWADFWHMGGYGQYVWLSYGLTFCLLGWVMLSPVLRRRALERATARQQRRTHQEAK